MDTKARAADLGIEHVSQGVSGKGATVTALLDKLGLHWPECAFMGDDLVDLPAMMQCGLAIAPANARPVVKQHPQGKLDAIFSPYPSSR